MKLTPVNVGLAILGAIVAALYAAPIVHGLSWWLGSAASGAIGW